jgi:hypothetical protein
MPIVKIYFREKVQGEKVKVAKKRDDRVLFILLEGSSLDLSTLFRFLNSDFFFSYIKRFSYFSFQTFWVAKKRDDRVHHLTEIGLRIQGKKIVPAQENKI